MKWRQEVVHDLIDQSGPFTHSDSLLAFATEQLSPLNRKPKLLDLRCGTGKTAGAFATAGWKVVGVDCSSEFEASWERLRQTQPECTFMVSHDHPILLGSEGSFDLVVAFDDLAVELVESENLQLALGYAFHSLRSGGLFVFQVDRSAPGATDTIEAAAEAGFRAAWRTSVADLGSPIEIGLPHRGSRDIFVARS